MKLHTEFFSISRSIDPKFKYQMEKIEREQWDKFTSNLEEAGSASEQHQDWIKKAAVGLKILTIVVTFLVGKYFCILSS